MSVVGGSTRYTISGLEEDSTYTVTVRAMNAIGSEDSNSASGMTREAGRQLNYIGVCVSDAI